MCRCILPQHRAKDGPPIFHSFPVFSAIEDDSLVERLATCDNCGALHRITDVGKSTVITGRDDSPIVMTRDDVRASLPQRLGDLLFSYDVHQSVWDEVMHICATGSWGSSVVIAREDIEGTVKYKTLRIAGADDFSVTSESATTLLSGGTP